MSSIKSFSTINQEKTYKFVKPVGDSEIFKQLRNGFIDIVNQDEFVENGSVNSFKSYIQDNQIYLTYDKPDSDKTYLLNIDLSDTSQKKTLREKTYNFHKDEFSDFSTFLADSLLFKLSINNKIGKVDIVNINTYRRKKNILNDSLIQNTSPKFSSLDQYLKKASRANYIPTLSVNKTQNGLYAVRVDCVLNTYRNNYNWWWHHQWFQQNMMMQMQFQQQQMMNNAMQNIPRFGPNPDLYVFSFSEALSSDDYFEFLLNTELNLVYSEEYRYLKPKIEKKRYIDWLTNFPVYSFESSVFTKNTFRYFYYDKYEKTVLIKERRLND